MSKNKKQSPNKAVQSREKGWIDIKNDELMVEEGLRQPKLEPRDESVWTKTPNEKRILRSVRVKSGLRTSIVPTKSIPVRDKLVIYLEKNNVYPKTTISTECWQHEISNIISNYTIIDRKNSKKDRTVYKNIVLKYSWNGKTYRNNELPVW
jgi:hypothetical protein